MSELLPHQRSKGPVSTPAQRLVELQRELLRVSSELQEANQRESKLRSQLDRFHRMTDTSFGGVAMAQTWTDLWMWEAILNENPKLRAIFEIGTWKGGFSWWLWAQAQARKMEFVTYDSVIPAQAMDAALEGSSHFGFFVKSDVFADAEVLGPAFHSYEPCVILCDGGNKPRELKTFSVYLEDHRSLMVVHDWGNEIRPADVPDTLEMVYGDFCDELGSISRVFRPKEK